jgi:hypothetical protein
VDGQFGCGDYCLTEEQAKAWINFLNSESDGLTYNMGQLDNGEVFQVFNKLK